MCRLFAYVHAGSPRSMIDALGPGLVAEFQGLASVHQDGWGAVWRQAGALASYRSTTPAHRDPVFAAVTALPLGSAVVHERLASPGIALSLDNQQPFTSGSLGFAHNGSIANAGGNVVHRPGSYRRSLGLEPSTTRSDSLVYAELFWLRLGQRLGSPDAAPTVDHVHRALSETLSALRTDYPDASYNNVITTPDFTFATQAHADHPRPSDGLRKVYHEAGWDHQLACYSELRCTSMSHADGAVTSAVSSSGYAAVEGWEPVPNNTLVVLDHRSGAVTLVPLDRR